MILALPPSAASQSLMPTDRCSTASTFTSSSTTNTPGFRAAHTACRTYIMPVPLLPPPPLRELPANEM